MSENSVPYIRISNNTNYSLSIVYFYADPSLGQKYFIKGFNMESDTIDPGRHIDIKYPCSMTWLRFEQLPLDTTQILEITNYISFCDVLIFLYLANGCKFAPIYQPLLKPNQTYKYPIRGRDYIVLIPIASPSPISSLDSHTSPSSSVSGPHVPHLSHPQPGTHLPHVPK